jgi:hypothetical protein
MNKIKSVRHRAETKFKQSIKVIRDTGSIMIAVLYKHQQSVEGTFTTKYGVDLICKQC